MITSEDAKNLVERLRTLKKRHSKHYQGESVYKQGLHDGYRDAYDMAIGMVKGLIRKEADGD